MTPDMVFEGEEIEALEVDAFEDDPTLKEDIWVVGKVLAHHLVNVTQFKQVMEELWSSRNCKEVLHAGHNLFSFRFASTLDRDLVLKSGPWFFDRFMITLSKYDAREDPAKAPLDIVPFWIQVSNLPRNGRTEAMAKHLGNSFAGYLD